MENRILQTYPQKDIWKNGKYQGTFMSPNIVRYADDFVILHEELAVVQRCQQIIADWLKDIGLELKPSKTRISHTLEKYEGEAGFNFLGFNIRQYRVAEQYSAKDTKGRILGFKSLIKPSKEAIKRHVEKIGKIIEAHKSVPQAALIGRLNPVIRGWANYYSTVVSKDTFSKIDHIVYQQLLAWGKFTYDGTPVKEIVRKCWQTVGNERWVFATKEGGKITARLLRHSQTPIVRHTKVKGEASPYDGNLVYWSTRRRKHPECPERIAELLRKQKGKCTWCKLHFREGDLLEVDHTLPTSQGGKDISSNRQLLHRHCHDEKTALDALKLLRQLAHEELARYLDDNPF